MTLPQSGTLSLEEKCKALIRENGMTGFERDVARSCLVLLDCVRGLAEELGYTPETIGAALRRLLKETSDER